MSSGGTSSVSGAGGNATSGAGAAALSSGGTGRSRAVDGAMFLFDSDDLHETLVAVRSPNMKPHHIMRMLGEIKISLATPTAEDLSKRYAELSPHFTQLGLDECSLSWGHRLSAARHEEADFLSGCGTIVQARMFMRRGVRVLPRHYSGKYLACFYS